MKYEEAYCSTEKELYTLDEVAYIFTNDTERYAQNFDGQLFCPGCRKVPLSFVNAKTPHFRGFRHFDHEDGCIHSKEEMPPSEVKGLIDSPAGENEIVHQMDRLLIQFLRNSGDLIEPATTPIPPSGDTGSGSFKKTRWQSNKVIPRKQINAPFFDHDFGTEKIFYGKAHIKWENDKFSDKKKLLIWGIKSNKLICRLYVTPNVYNHLPRKYTDVLEYDAFIIFLTSLNRQDPSKSWSQGFLRKSFFLSINKLATHAK